MVDKNELRAAFSARLHEALDDAGVRTRGRGVDIHAHLVKVGAEKSTQAISKWLNGDAIPEADSMSVLCSWLKVRREWLEYGVLPKEQIGSTNTRQFAAGTDSNIHEINQLFGKVPLISWVQAGAWCEANFEHHDGESWLSCPVPISKNGFALKVLGDSMTNPGPGRSYPTGCIIFVDPEADTKAGDRVIARVPRTNEATFKILVEDAGRQFLRPINPQYPIIDITEETHICGKVVGSFIPE
ncbi:LexA family protein [Pseudomonas gessardii]|uniref:LexA family protein n=1 Tax=Pseudomonas gessardii TaxID=78544 RepID=UPI001472A0A4|nr:S24 family peptidase [Pseudomonas gessardii]NNA66183.1 peptidase S24 [Pseudomonas gessardii]